MMPEAVQTLDVAIIGGGPAGSTVGSILKKYDPKLKVGIFEREVFPRDHIGESQLPVIGQVLNEIGVWNKIEAAGFPIKVGATYRWGREEGFWDFNFIENADLKHAPRPGKYDGQRIQTAFQVDRSIYDKILLDHSAEMGCEVRQGVSVRKVSTEGDRVTGLTLEGGEEVKARWYIDASGHAGILRRALGVEIDCPTKLQNIAIWDYWQNAEWIENIGVGGTRIVVISVGYGWLWFIPLGPTRTSLGLVIPAEYYRQSGKRPEELYTKAIAEAPKISELIRNATSEGKLTTTKDWSFLSERIAGENWLLTGESAGFADPILSAGMSLAHIGGRQAAYVILADDRRDHHRDWLLKWYDETHRAAISQHIRFADFWYSSNGCFTDLIDYTSEIAKDAGLRLEPEAAWQWLGTGGFVDHNVVGAGHGGYSLRLSRQIAGNFLGTDPKYFAGGMNLFKLDLEGATLDWGAQLGNGRILRHKSYRRGDRFLPDVGLYGFIIAYARNGTTAEKLWAGLKQKIDESRMPKDMAERFISDAFDAVDAMIADGWLIASRDDNRPGLESPAANMGIVGPRSKA